MKINKLPVFLLLFMCSCSGGYYIGDEQQAEDLDAYGEVQELSSMENDLCLQDIGYGIPPDAPESRCNNSLPTQIPYKVKNTLGVSGKSLQRVFTKYGFKFESSRGPYTGTERALGKPSEKYFTSFVQLDTINDKIYSGIIWIEYTGNQNQILQDYQYLYILVTNLLPEWSGVGDWMDKAGDEIVNAMNRGDTSHKVVHSVSTRYGGATITFIGNNKPALIAVRIVAQQ